MMMKVQHKKSCIAGAVKNNIFLLSIILIKDENDTEMGKDCLLIKFGRDPTSKKSGLY